MLFLASIFCAIVYSIRRHRIDDIRGRYRIWAAAALACLVLSANSVAGMHAVLADVLKSVTGWSALRDGAVWWMAVAGLPLSWILVRALVDIRECRVGVVLLLTASVCYAISVANFLGYGFAGDARTAPILVAAPLLFGHWLMFAAIVSYARFVVLDAQGLVTLRRPATVKRSTKAASARPANRSTTQSVSSDDSSPLASFVRRAAQSGKQPAESSQWVDGSRHERDRYNDDDEDDATDGDRKLSKSDRKRLRKLKAQGRAA